jgi:pyruvate/2-oxoglutarate dehydrogenase complex dihydrolipoamide acyltransferase (E2) component
MPQLGESIAGPIVSFLVKPGDPVEADQDIISRNQQGHH